MKTAREFIDEKVGEKDTNSLMGWSVASDFMEEYAQQKAIEFAGWITDFNWICIKHPTDANQKVWVKSYWSFADINVWRTTQQLFNLYIDYEAMNDDAEPTRIPK